MFYILESITNNSKKVIAVSDSLEEIKNRMSDELHSLNEDILDYVEENVQTIVTENMVIYGYNNLFYCYRIVMKWDKTISATENDSRIDDGGGAN